MIQFFSELNKNQKGLAFEKFLISVLQQQALKMEKEIKFDVGFENLGDNFLRSDNFCFDGYAPNGFKSNVPTIFEFKFQITNNMLSQLLSKIHSPNRQHNINLIIITYSDLEDNYQLISQIKQKTYDNINVEIWDKHIVDVWIEEYPIDYQNTIAFFINKSVTAQNVINDFDITDVDFETKNENNISLLRDEIRNNECFSLVLGAGVSIDLGAKSWKGLLKDFETELLKRGVIHDVNKVKENVGSSALISAQLCKDLYNNDSDFYWAIHQSLYPSTATKKSAEMDEIIEIIKHCYYKKRFRILTYNFDDYLERHMIAQGIKYTTLFNEKGIVNDLIPIYHVHGFLPEVKAKSYIQSTHSKSIFLTEENYNDLYNKPYSWQISSQLSFFRENQCLFVGCSLSDPNIRRLLETTRETPRKHFAILVKDKMDTHDLLVASNHFARLNIEIIWANDFPDISKILHRLY